MPTRLPTIQCGVIFTLLLFLPIAYCDDLQSRETLVKTQNELRSLVAKTEGHPPTRDYYSAALETTDAAMLAAQGELELGVLASLQGKPSEARDHWKASRRLLEAGSQEGKRWLRRVNAAIVQQELIDLDQKDNSTLVTKLISEANAVAYNNPLPTSGATPARQLRVEHWLFSAAIMFQTSKWLSDCPKDTELAGTKRALETICQHRLLTEKLIVGQRTTDHEALIDNLLFEKGMLPLFDSLLRKVKLSGADLPKPTKTTWLALLAAWATESPTDRLPSLILEKDDLSKLEQAAQFQTLSTLASVLNRFKLPDANRKLAKQIATLDASACPPDEAAMTLADLMLEGSQLSAADAFLKAAETGGPNDDISLLRIKLLYAQGRNVDAASKAAEMANHNGPPESYYWQGKALLALNKQADARKAFRDLMCQAPESRLAPEACLLSGMLSANLHEAKLASTYFEETKARYPNSKEARRASELMNE